MDPNHSRPHPRPVDTQPDGDDGQLPMVGPVASQGQLPPAHEAPVSERDRLPMPHSLAVPTPSPGMPVSPMAQESTSTEYFPQLPTTTNLTTTRSRSSLQSSMRRPSSSAASAFAETGTPSIPRQPSIRIRRRGGSASSNRSAFEQALATGNFAGLEGGNAGSNVDVQGRARSISQPERSYAPPQLPQAARHSRRQPQVAMPRLTEEGNRPTMEELGVPAEAQPQPLSPTWSMPEQTCSNTEDPITGERRAGPLRRMSNFLWPKRTVTSDSLPQQAGLAGAPSRNNAITDDEYDAAIVDYLDTIDPEVQTLSTLTNVQNSLFVPDLGSWLNRRPTYNLSQHEIDAALPRLPQAPPVPPKDIIPEVDEDKDNDKDNERVAETPGPSDPPTLERSSTITSRLTESHYAALPHGTTLEGWTADEKCDLDDHVRHMLHSRRSKFKRSLKGFGQYVRRPLGFFVTLYATLITLFGLAWVLFLIGWIYLGSEERTKYLIHVIDSVLVALFAIMGDGLAPFRAVDTYHMFFVIRYARIVKKARLKREKLELLRKQTTPSECQPTPENCASVEGLPGTNCECGEQIGEEPHRHDSYTMANNIVDAEDAKSGIAAYEDTPLTYAQQKKLHHHQTKLAKSHSFYKPDETNTHYAFPLGYLVATVLLLDCHSCLQISLGATTWGIDYRTRNIAITTVILCVSIACNITAGIVITIGGRKTRKKDVWMLMTRQELTGDAMKIVERKRSKDDSATGEKSGSSDSDNATNGEKKESSFKRRWFKKTSSGESKAS